MTMKLLLAATALGFATLAGAQTTTPAPAGGASQDPGVPHAPLPADRGYDKNSPRTEAINAPNRGELAAANNAGGAQAGANAAADTRANVNAQVAYDYDMANYVAALRAHNQAAAADARHYDRQQRAYADAMRAWRIQVYDCSRGITAACRAPTPDPAAFW